MMESGRFPPATPPESHFRYEAVALYGSGFLSRRYRIQIDDYAGEHLDEFNASSERLFTRSDFFQYVISSDALLIMIDCERLLNSKYQTETDPVPYWENILVATLHTLIEKRSEDPTEPSVIPVGLILSKSDLVTDVNDTEYILARISRLISVCQKRFRYFRHFFVSSVGTVPEEDRNGVAIPPKELNPIGVVEPLLWTLGK